jgi:hypothetical protein
MPLFVLFDWRMSHLSAHVFSSHEETSEKPLSSSRAAALPQGGAPPSPLPDEVLENRTMC